MKIQVWVCLMKNLLQFRVNNVLAFNTVPFHYSKINSINTTKQQSLFPRQLCKYYCPSGTECQGRKKININFQCSMYWPRESLKLDNWLPISINIQGHIQTKFHGVWRLWAPKKCPQKLQIFQFLCCPHVVPHTSRV